MLQIISNGSKWIDEAPDELETLIDVLKTEPLDPSFEEYGNFCYYNSKTNDFTVLGNFAHRSHVFNLRGTLKDLQPILKLIKANKRTPEYLRLAAKMGLR